MLILNPQGVKLHELKNWGLIKYTYRDGPDFWGNLKKLPQSAKITSAPATTIQDRRNTVPKRQQYF
jgi:hypothetical protein